MILNMEIFFVILSYKINKMFILGDKIRLGWDKF